MCMLKLLKMKSTPEKIVMFSPDRELLWPGALIQGASHKAAVGSLLPLTKSPATIGSNNSCLVRMAMVVFMIMAAQFERRAFESLHHGLARRLRAGPPERFEQHAKTAQVKMIELKLSQGAKPGHGGVLPGAKVTPEIAAARGVPVGQDCVSPASHSAFSTPLELMAFVARLRELSGGKPVGFKLCIGHPWEWFAICKAMLETGLVPDFIVPMCRTTRSTNAARSWAWPRARPWRT